MNDHMTKFRMNPKMFVCIYETTNKVLPHQFSITYLFVCPFLVNPRSVNT